MPPPITQTWQPGDWAVVRRHTTMGHVVHAMEWLAGYRGDYEHAITGLHNGMIAEAEGNGYRIAYFPYDPADVVWSTGRLPEALTPSDRQREAICMTHRRWEAEHVGYAWTDYAAIAAHRFHLWAPGLQDFVADTGHMICSQAVDAGQAENGIHLFADGRWDGYVTPDDLAGLLGVG